MSNYEHPLFPYPSPDKREEILDILAEEKDISIIEYGKSAEERPLRAACIRPLNSGSPRVLCNGNIHGIEFISSHIALSFMSRLSRPEGAFKQLRERAEIWIIPCLNPDGYARTWLQQGRGSIAGLRTNKNGVDLNRNFPLPAGKRRSILPLSGSSRKGAITYRGKGPLSEPETKSLESFLCEKNFHACANLHSFSGVVIPAMVKERSSYNSYHRLAKSIRDEQPHFGYRRISNRFLDVYTGELDDYLHHHHNCWSVCIESMTLIQSLKQNLRRRRLFWLYNPGEPEVWVENELPGLCSYFLTALEMQIP